MRQADVAKAFGRAVGRPAVMPTPALALKLTLGDAAVLVTDSHRTDPVVVRARGYGWEYGDLDASLGARIP
jgi:NAD dependent epimerase/dehydratase family enzyme